MGDVRLEGVKKNLWSLKGYHSLLGAKIAAVAGVFMTIPVFAYLMAHEYYQEGFGELRTIGLSPFLWGGILFSFVALMAVLSKVFILPIKRFVLHIEDIEKGNDVEPFLLSRRDELGYLTRRFDSLQRIVKNEIESRDQQLSILHDFTNAAAGIFDISTLMDNFFNILRTSVEFDIGAYVLSYENMAEGKIYSTCGMLEEADEKEITARLLKKVSGYNPGFPREKFAKVPVTHIYAKPHHGGNDKPTHFIDLPLVCYGAPIGIISLISYTSTGTDPLLGSRVFNAMVRHTSSVVERLLTHISAEEKKLSHILSSMSEGIYIIDRDGRAASINRKGMELVDTYCKNNLECVRDGYGPGCCTAMPWEACEFSKVINKVRILSPELDGKVYTEEIKNKKGQIIQLSVSNLMTENNTKEGYVVTAKDVTEDRLIQKRVMLSSKLAALGEMAAGIAHEVNNPLQVMMANIELLETSASDKNIRRIENLKDGILRIKGIVRDLLIFAREETTESEDVDINTVVEKVVGILRNQLKVANIGIELDLDRRALVVKCNKNLFQQVIINLLQNAKDAIEESKKGSKVFIRTVQLPGGIAVVEVADDGPGIPDSAIDRIFDPFFTTKDPGKGTGLGLSVSRRIIEGMGGSISVASSKAGTRFTINLLHQRAARRKEGAELAERDYSRLASKSVVIVDDEVGVLKAVKDTIGRSLKSIDCYNEGVSALEAIMDSDFDFILLDIKMPGLNGMELYRKVCEAKPYLAERVIFLTGDTENETTESFIKLTGCKYLAKPFALKELLGIMCEYDPEVRA